jgi:nucleotide-binding universal stress UspA family protein
MFDRKTILLPVDFSDRSLEAARQARGIARRVRCRLVVLNVEENGGRDLQFEPGGASVQELPSYLNREFRDTPVEYVTEAGEPAEIIDQVAIDKRADLIVIGGHIRRPFEAFAAGSVTAEVLCSAPCPVLVSLHEERGPAPLFRSILCPVKLSDSTGATLDWALQFARAFEAKCDVIHVAANSNGEEPHRITEERLTYVDREALDAVKDKLDGLGQLILAAGSVASVIAAASVDLKSDLLVMGRSRSRDEFARVHSLPFTLARRAACPVVVI